MNRSRRTWIAAGVALLGLLVAAVAGAVAYAPIAEREVAESRELCVRCHDYRDVARPATHRSTACQSCHEVPEANRLGLFLAAKLGTTVPPHGDSQTPSCQTCHSASSERWRATMRSEGHNLHSAEPALVQCTRCHGESLHRAATPDTGCLSCHSDVPLHSEPRGEGDCTACHLFTQAGEDIEPEELSTSWRRQVGVENVHGAAQCQRCHNPHEAAPNANAAYCSRCHRGNVSEQAANSQAHQQCQSCHQPHASREQVAAPCVQCHSPPQLLTDGRFAGSWRIGQGDPTTASLSHEGRCQRCHQPHEWRANAARCPQCHAEPARELAPVQARGHHPTCISCHNPHGPPPGATVCRGCHQDRVRSGTPTPHQDCLGCHDQHRGAPSGAAPCSRCHREPVSQVANGPTPHRNCLNCHTAHGDPRAASAAACGRCHGAQRAQFSGGGIPEPHQRCASCHRPHEFARAPSANRCASCHSMAVAEGAPHRGACAQCHQQHGRPLGNAARCASCHGAIRPTVSQHQRCNGCHQPHTPAERAQNGCANCHANRVRGVAAWPQGIPHARCRNCHTPHDESTTRACPSCHAEQNTVTHRGNHPRCQGCHDVHAPPRRGGDGWWGACATCHRSEAAGAASARVERHRRCVNCHQPFGATPPTCTTCHGSIRQTLLHQVPQHQQCTTCHQRHGTASPTRARCTTSCHQDRQTHFPDSPQCQSCHPFGD